MIEKQKDGSIFITSDSPYCHYCARKLYPDPEYDEGMCETCTGASNFLGIQCVTTDPRDA
jgi:hypothetical protein